MQKLRPHALPLLFLIAATWAVYGHTVGHDFLMNWDDNTYVTVNSSVHGFSAANLRDVFSSYYAGNYAPLQMLSYMLDYTLWGLWPGGYLLTNVLLHTLNGILLYALIVRSYGDGDRTMAVIGAAIFLLHPVQVESVAWISQRKNLLAMFFMLLSWLAYCRYRREAAGPARLAYGASLAAFVLSLLAKSATVFFPLALLLYDGCFPVDGRRIRLLDKLPYGAAAAAIGLLALHSQSPDVVGWSGLDSGGRRNWHGGTPWSTLLTMLPVFCSYLRMIVWPSGLSALYDPVIHTGLDAAVVAAALLLLLVAALIHWCWRTDRRLGFWPLFAVIALLPVAQIVPLITIMNDRYLYFPMIGLATLGGVAAAALRERSGTVVTGIVAVCILCLALVSFQRAGVWADSRTLWKDAAAKAPGRFEVWEGLGEAYHLAPPVRLPEAETAYQRGFALYSSSPTNLYNYARVKKALGKDDQALLLLRRLLRLYPDHVMGWAALGDIHAGRQRYREAERAYREAERLQPEAAEVNSRLADLYRAEGDEARAQFYDDRAENARP